MYTLYQISCAFHFLSILVAFGHNSACVPVQFLTTCQHFKETNTSDLCVPAYYIRADFMPKEQRWLEALNGATSRGKSPSCWGLTQPVLGHCVWGLRSFDTAKQAIPTTSIWGIRQLKAAIPSICYLSPGEYYLFICRVVLAFQHGLLGRISSGISAHCDIVKFHVRHPVRSRANGRD